MHQPPGDPAPADRTGESIPVVPRPASPARVRTAHDDEFTAFMLSAGPDLLRTAWLLVGDAHRAEELTQQALVRTYVAWPRVRGGNPTAYARRTLVNLRTDTWRRRRREVLTSPVDLPDAGAAPDPGPDDRDEVVRALAGLTPRQRRVVVLRHLVGLSEQEVADDLGISVGTVKSTSSRALASLRSTLDPHDDGAHGAVSSAARRSHR
ncbi:SigE family RNA polymerase sigma factor [Cellulomonas sp. zg-ZUI222]|uniref:SigE family RNA polymerase sigma factor n=1 Tax=Cellulomonas TaxID=1707 RepID=UPI001A9467FF|nr:SigE family RNA polymerase sigma factor [Cellulomonas sp. zg-ZUI22]MBO0921066.1 SigE family RNA polymerase sigma factor [Cellulomonas wangleii]